MDREIHDRFDVFYSKIFLGRNGRDDQYRWRRRGGVKRYIHRLRCTGILEAGAVAATAGLRLLWRWGWRRVGFQAAELGV